MPTWTTVSRREQAFQELVAWLHDNGLTVDAGTFDVTTPPSGMPTDFPELVGVATDRGTRIEPCDEAKLKQILHEWSHRGVALNNATQRDAVWQELRDLSATIRRIEPARVPAEAIAFYRGFHVTPVHQWGIYIVVPRLLAYLDVLVASYGGLKTLDRSLLASLVLFDVFHHEFFHHLVECTATSIELLWPTQGGGPPPVYFLYRMGRWRDALGEHAHDPLEEALANAYAYNSFSFASRVQRGYVASWAGLYQRALQKSWPKEPPGYREAIAYTKGHQLDGAEILLRRMLCGVVGTHTAPLAMLAQAVFPRGHAAFWAKPDVPTYLLGTPEEVQRFHALVPAPNEAYCGLFWPGSTTAVDAFLKEQREKERLARKEGRLAEAEARRQTKQRSLF